MRLHVAADLAVSEHLGDPRNRGKAGLTADPSTANDGHGR
jgi:hypothetical protein